MSVSTKPIDFINGLSNKILLSLKASAPDIEKLMCILIGEI